MIPFDSPWALTEELRGTETLAYAVEVWRGPARLGPRESPAVVLGRRPCASLGAGEGLRGRMTDPSRWTPCGVLRRLRLDDPGTS